MKKIILFLFSLITIEGYSQTLQNNLPLTTAINNGFVVYTNTSGFTTSGSFTTANIGSVTSVGYSTTLPFTVAGSPITTSGTFTVTPTVTTGFLYNNAGTATWSPISYTVQDVTPVTTNTVTATANRLALNPAGTIAALTVVFPASPTNGQIFGINTTHTITSITLVGGAGGASIQTNFTSINANSYINWFYDASQNFWLN